MIRMYLCAAALLAAFVSSSLAQDQPDPRTPEEVLEFIKVAESGWPHQYDHIYARIAADRDRYAILVAESLLPEREFEGWIPFGEAWPGNGGIFAHGVFQILGRVHADPILTAYFRDGYRLYREATGRLDALQPEVGEQADAKAFEEQRAMLFLKQRTAMGMMTQAVAEAMRLQSPVLVDDLLKFWEAGYNDRQSGLPRYPLLFAHEREDIVPRLRAVMENPKTDPMVKHQIKKAFEWHAARLASADQGEAALAEADTKSPPPAPSPEPAQPPR
jgi:hypothetical protein